MCVIARHRDVYLVRFCAGWMCGRRIGRLCVWLFLWLSVLLVVVLRCCEGAGIRGGPFRVVRREGLRIVVVWRRATFPHPVGWSIIAVPGLSFRVRDGAGRFSWAVTATKLYSVVLLVVGWRPDSRRG